MLETSKSFESLVFIPGKFLEHEYSYILLSFPRFLAESAINDDAKQAKSKYRVSISKKKGLKGKKYLNEIVGYVLGLHLIWCSTVPKSR